MCSSGEEMTEVWVCLWKSFLRVWVMLKANAKYAENWRTKQAWLKKIEYAKIMTIREEFGTPR